jgi:hypothetical protein
MAIAIQNLQTLNSATNTTSYTLNYTVPSGSDRLLAVLVSGQRAAGATFSLSGTYGGAALSVANTVEFQSPNPESPNRWYRTTAFYLIAPPVGAADIVITSSQTLVGMIIAARTLTGVNQSDPIGDAATATASVAALNLALTGLTTGSLVLAHVGTASAGPPTWTWTNGTEDYDLSNGNNVDETAATGAQASPGGGSLTLTATRSAAGHQLGVAVEFLPVAAALAAHRKTAGVRLSTKVGGLLA